MKIILVRHAKVLLPHKQLLYASEMPAGVEAYDQAPIETAVPDRDTLVRLAEGVEIRVCSGLSRSRRSLALLGYAPDIRDSLFDEVAIPHVTWRGIKLPPPVWLVSFRIASLFGYRGGGESLGDIKRRAVRAVDRLLSLDTQAQSVMLLGHGLFNRFIAKELKKRHWRETKALGSANWSYGIFERERPKEK
jgi:broad specificity phosphatase PhoE